MARKIVVAPGKRLAFEKALERSAIRYTLWPLGSLPDEHRVAPANIGLTKKKSRQRTNLESVNAEWEV